jgi:antitoxin component YwqK of YwqJK toxin-antitoxin module
MSTVAQPRQAAQPQERYCKNEDTIMGDKTIDIPESKLYISPSGNCFNVSEDLFGHIMAGNNTDPYTQIPLWTNRAEMLVLLAHPGWTPEERERLRTVLLSPLRPEVVDVLSRSPLFTEVYNVGAILFSDYTTDFKISTIAIAQYLERLDKAGPDGTMILNLRERRVGNPETIKEILYGAAASCIHDVGLRLIRFYLDLWFMMPAKSTPLRKLPKPIGLGFLWSLDQIATVAISLIADAGVKETYILLYIFDLDNMGQQSYLWYFMDDAFRAAPKQAELAIPHSLKSKWKEAAHVYTGFTMKEDLREHIKQAKKFSLQVFQKLVQSKPKIVILQSTYDPNGAFDKGGDKGLIEVFSRIKEFDVKHAYMSDIFGGGGIISILKQIFAESGPIAHLVIIAHGTASNITVSCTRYSEKTTTCMKLSFDNLEHLADIIKSTLAPKASIFLHSCAVGQGSKSIAEQLSIQSGRTVWGAEQNIHRGDVLVTKITVHDDYLDIIYDIDNDQVRSQGRRPYRMIEFGEYKRQQRKQRGQKRQLPEDGAAAPAIDDSDKGNVKLWPNGSPMTISYKDPITNKYHRTNGSALTMFYKNGKIKSEYWYIQGKYHQKDGPAVINYYDNGKIKSEHWYIQGNPHRIGGPAKIDYYDDGKIKSEYWYNQGKYHQKDGPAVIDYYDDGKIKSEYWYNQGKYHRKDGPAVIDYYDDGKIKSEYWYNQGNPHRIGGPAKIDYYDDGKIKSEYWYNQGKHTARSK